MAQIYIGTSGFSQQQFYPDKLSSSKKLKFYTQIFNSVEINSTFYHFPRVTTIQNWKTNTTDNFIFTFKISQFITRSNKLNTELLDKWFDIFKPFASEQPKHLMLFQYSASYIGDFDEFKGLIEYLPKTFLYAFEIRNPEWLRDEVFDLIANNNMALVLSDSPMKKNGEYLWPKVDLPQNPFLYIRFHGGDSLYRSSYSDQQLEEYAKLIKKNLALGKNVYVYFNNDARGFATKNAQTLQKLLV